MLIHNRKQAREGTVTAVAAVSLIGILGAVALSLDGGMMIDKRRQIQSAADAAALAACDDLYLRWYTNAVQGFDNASGTAAAAAKNAAKKNGFEHGVNGCTVTVHIAPTSGDHVGEKGHVEVIITHSQKRYFSKIFGSSNVPIGARAVARGYRRTIKQAILVLDPIQKSAFNAGGNGAITVTGSPIQVNSTDPEGMIDNGGGTAGSVTDTTGFNLGGSPGWTVTGGATINGPKNPNSPPIPDPLAELPAPDPSTLTTQSTKKLQHSSAQNITLNPGVYIGGISVTGKGNVTMNPGIYYMQGGGFSVTGQGNITANGVMIYNNPSSNSDTISIAGSGVMTFSPPTSGPYQGITLFQNRTATADVSVSGGSGSVMQGLFYAANALMKITGGGGAQIGSQYISRLLTIQGNGDMHIDWSANQTPGIREIYLVE